MSQEILHDLSREAISRMNPYELVERAVGLRSAMHNNIELEPIPLEHGGTLYAVTSGLAATCGRQEEINLEGNDLVRRQFVPLPVTAFADVVELRPPTSSTEGDARLYRVEQSLPAVSAEARLPFHATAVELITTPDPVHGTMSPIRFSTTNVNIFYKVVHSEAEDRGTTWLSSGGDLRGHVPVQAGPQTDVQVQIVGKDELNGDHGVLTSVSGPAHITLEQFHFARITDTGVLCGPSSKKTVAITLTPDTPQHHNSRFHRIPDDATVGPNADGDLIPYGERAAGRDYKGTKLNPNISAATALGLLPPDAIDWTDGTAAFVSTLSHRIIRMLPLDTQGSYQATLQAAREKITETLLTANRQAAVGHVGCLAVAARLAELPATIHGTTPVDAAFFGVSRTSTA